MDNEQEKKTHVLNFINIINTRITYYRQVLEKTHIIIQNNKKNDILNTKEYLKSISKIQDIFNNIDELKNIIDQENKLNKTTIIDKLQQINNMVSMLFKKYGTQDIFDILKVCVGTKFIDMINNDEPYYNLYCLLNKYCHPISFEIQKHCDTNNNHNKMVIQCNNDCSLLSNNFYIKINGITILFYNAEEDKYIIINCIVDNPLLNNIDSQYISSIIKYLQDNIPNIQEDYTEYVYSQYIQSLTLKDILSTKQNEFYEIFAGIINQNKIFKQKTLNAYIKDFISDSLFNKRKKIISLLLYDKNPEYYHIAYILYDILSSDKEKVINNSLQTKIYDSLPYSIQIKLKNAIIHATQYNENITNLDKNEINIEQQIALMKVNDNVKQKAIAKYKEVQSKGEDSGSKAKQFLDGLLKIPFGIYKNEDILNTIKYLRNHFKEFLNKYSKFIKNYLYIEIPQLDEYNLSIIFFYIKQIRNSLLDIYNGSTDDLSIVPIINYITSYTRRELIELCKVINKTNKQCNIDYPKIKTTNKKNNELIENIMLYLYSNIIDNIDNDTCKNNEKLVMSIKNNNYSIWFNIYLYHISIRNLNNKEFIDKAKDFYQTFYSICNSFNCSKSNIENIKSILEDSVYGHQKAKRQLERIIAQWMSGEQKGYCFGFEGPPGVGKCHAYNTDILMYNGFKQKVQDIQPGQYIMGDDSSKRKVLSICNGFDKMYEIKYNFGDSYIVNQEHILCLKFKGTKTSIKKKYAFRFAIYILKWFDPIHLEYKEQTIKTKHEAESLQHEFNNIIERYIFEMPVKKFISLNPKIQKLFVGYKTSVSFNALFPNYNTDVDIDPEHFYDIFTIPENIDNIQDNPEYNNTISITNPNIEDIDNSNNNTNISTNDVKILNYKPYNLATDAIYGYNSYTKQYIPENILYGSFIDRLLYIKRVIELCTYDNFQSMNAMLLIININDEFLKQLVYLIRSVGFHCILHDYTYSYYIGHLQQLNRKIFISGKNLYNIDELINSIHNRSFNPIDTPITNTFEFSIHYSGYGKYYGFELDGNKRYIMGDFTVTHNTSLAKSGLSKCLTDKDGNKRPFGFIPLGGSSHGSLLNGHSYTYVGSTWGRIVDILIDSKCMNPIIFIDELDKVSKTEQGKEIIGILTHMIDSTQNDCFQDKYFAGIDIDLSKALFIFSYNDASLIDKILLDRIHRIKFDNLTLEEKITICYKYLLPELYKNVSFNEEHIVFSKEVLQFIIENYTYEPGVRKLKEILFEIISEINLKIITMDLSIETYPYYITNDDIKNNYLKERRFITHSKIHSSPQVGIINGLWANSIGFGGIIPIQCYYYPSNSFLDFNLTGMQGDVMKESMNVAKTIAFNLTDDNKKTELIEIFKNTKMQGIHIHCPEGATPKDGPSAGTAITICIYSLLNNLKIKNNIAITGEINLQGNITQIGGLDLKILGGIRAGVDTFYFPKDNLYDFEMFKEKYSKQVDIDRVRFYPVSHINDLLDCVFSEETS